MNKPRAALQPDARETRPEGPRRLHAAAAAFIEAEQERDRIERDARAHLEQAEREAQGRRDRDLRALQEKTAEQLQRLEREKERAIAALEETAVADRERIEAEYKEARDRTNAAAEEREEKVRARWKHEVWLIESDFEGVVPALRKDFEKECQALTAARDQVREADDEARRLLDLYRQQRLLEEIRPPEEESPGEEFEGDAAARLNSLVALSAARLQSLRSLTSARLFHGPLLWLLVGLAAVAAFIGVGVAVAWRPSVWLAVAPVGTLLLSAGGVWLLYRSARTRCRELYLPIAKARAEADAVRNAGIVQARARAAQREQQAIAKHQAELKACERKFAPAISEARLWRRDEAGKHSRHYPAQLQELKETLERSVADVHRQFESQTSRLESESKTAETGIVEACDARIAEAKESVAVQRRHAQERCVAARAELDAIVASVNAHLRSSAPAWSDAQWRDWSPRAEFPSAIPFGAVEIAVPGQEDQTQTTFPVPALLPFPEDVSLLIEFGQGGRERALSVLRDVTLRLLTSLPPGKANFTFIDPVSLGQNFAGFMHLSDYSEKLVGERVWTEPRHIEQKLADLTEHMENVIQKYLRNDFETIAEYNEQAGEIAEPYRFLVLADCPINLSDQSARRLMSIVASGRRCGVYTLIAHDTREPLPAGLQMEDLREQCTRLVQEGDRFVWSDDLWRPFRLTLEEPPGDEAAAVLVHTVGRESVDATRVQVPFETIMPPAERVWTLNSASEITVPLGRAGATRLQPMSLGKGTSQHALIAGKTGSGKSTLFHVLICNLAMWYGPDQVEMYLVDFKKGVEFKAYALADLPHARAIAIESDREFGVSVLERVDAELRRRGTLFRDVGAQDLASFRAARPDVVMPRTLLIIDEFQEFFTEDDKLAQDASLLLDRLVRQGRAFGVHVILGSQTLGGAYGLARSTIGQMAVRIALQCSEADAFLIMNEENSAARLLSRPGEAIYNDASGMIGGNSPFQVAWLPDQKREQFLRPLRARAADHPTPTDEPVIVFEGNVPADVRRNALLDRVLDRAGSADRSTRLAPVTWFGDAIAIKEPTSATFRRQSGANLMVVGQNDESAQAMLAISMIALSAQIGPDGTLIVFDGTPPDDRFAGLLKEAGDLCPCRVRHVAWREIDAVFADLAGILKKRQEESSHDAPGIFVILNGLQRFRMLRRKEDDFRFSLDEEEAAPAGPEKIFPDLLREGPPHGIHTLLWADSPVTIDRTFDRQMLREFELRILFQMSAADSSNLIDSAAASRLGLRRALFYSEEMNLTERFRPYALPPGEWLDSLRTRLPQGSRSLSDESPSA